MEYDKNIADTNAQDVLLELKMVVEASAKRLRNLAAKSLAAKHADDERQRKNASV